MNTLGKPMPESVISSMQNTRIKNAVKLRQRSQRDRQGVFIVEGIRELGRALDNGRIPELLFVCEPITAGKAAFDQLERCRASGTEILRCSSRVFEKITYCEKTDGLLALMPRTHARFEDLSLPENPIFVVAETIEKPGNLGAILRSADAAGATAVIVCDGRTDIHNPNVVRASTGSIFSVPVIETSSPKALEWLRDHGILIVAASPGAKPVYTGIDLRKGCAIAVGAEHPGLSSFWMKEADFSVRIPMRGQADSLNVATAATILLFEADRQRNSK